MKKILIIGASGMLGQELADVFKDYNPSLWDRSEIDIANKDLVVSKISAEKPALIINAAAYNDVDGAVGNIDIANNVNGYGPGYLSQAANHLGSILVHYSTDYVFKGDKKEGYIELDEPNPQSIYAKSKLLGEQMVMKNTDKYYIIRLSRLFGESGKSGKAKKSFVNLMLDLAKKNEELNVVSEELSSPTYAPDLAKRTKELIDGQYKYGIYHAANEGACTWYEFAEEIFRIKNIDIKLNPVKTSFYPRPAARPAYSILLNTKLPKARTWKEALNEFLK